MNQTRIKGWLLELLQQEPLLEQVQLLELELLQLELLLEQLLLELLVQLCCKLLLRLRVPTRVMCYEP